MKKACLFFGLITIFIFTLSSCKVKPTDIPFTGKKPNPFYYTKLLAEALVSYQDSTAIILETNLHKEKELPAEGIGLLKNFFKSIKTGNFIDKPSELPEKPLYRIYIKAQEDKYIINVYNDKYISIHPWDGVYPMDFIDMRNVPALYNINSLCKYYIK